MPRVRSSNRTRLLRIDMFPFTAPTLCIFGNPTPPGQGLEAGNQLAKQEMLKTPGINSIHQAQLLPDSFSQPHPQVFITGGGGGGHHPRKNPHTHAQGLDITRYSQRHPGRGTKTASQIKTWNSAPKWR